MGRGGRQSSRARVVAPRREGRDAAAPWRPRELQRDYRSLLDRAKEEPQTILDSDGSMLVVEPKERADFERQLAEHVAAAAQFQAAYAANREREPASWAAQTPFPWLASFEPEEVGEFARELLGYTLDAAQRGTLENLEGNLRAWRSTASIYEQPELLAALTAPIDPDKLQEVFPPSEEQVREAQGA
jgi:hypothetical protein